MTETFAKYDIGGAYHWKWYLVDYEGYRGFTNALVDMIPGPGRLLDVGCGDGLISYLFFRQGFDVVGLDTSETGIGLANLVTESALRNGMGADIESVQDTPFTHGNTAELLERFDRGGLRFECQLVYDLSDKDAFDFSICSEVIEHVEFPEKLLENVHRSVRNFAIITTPNSLRPDGTIDDPDKYDYHAWSPETFADLLDGYDFEFLDLRPDTIAVKLNCS